MFILVIALIMAVGASAIAAVVVLLWGATTEDRERGKRVGLCLLAIALAAISALSALVALHGLELISGEIHRKFGAYLVIGIIFVAFAAVCLLPVVVRRPKKPNQSLQPT